MNFCSTLTHGNHRFRPRFARKWNRTAVHANRGQISRYHTPTSQRQGTREQCFVLTQMSGSQRPDYDGGLLSCLIVRINFDKVLGNWGTRIFFVPPGRVSALFVVFYRT